MTIQPDIFISYASRRREAVEHFARILQSWGLDVWYDYDLIEGSDFAFQLDGILRSSRLIVVLWCSLSVSSRWVQEEATLANDLGRLFPIMMEPCDLQLGTRRIQYADLTDWDGSVTSQKLDQVIESIGKKLRKELVADPQRQLNLERLWRQNGSRGFASFPIRSERPKAAGVSGVNNTRNEQVHSRAIERLADLPRGSLSLVTPGRLTIGCYPYAPVAQGSDADEMIGPWIELGRTLASRLDLNPVFRLSSFSDMLKNSYSAVDVMLGVFETKRRQEYFEFSRPINRIGLSGICSTRLSGIDEGALRAGDLKVAVQDGEVGWEYAQDEMPRAVEKKKVITIDTVDGLDVLGLVADGKCDVALMDLLSCVNFLRAPNNSRNVHLAFDGPIDMFDCCIALRKTSGLNKKEIDVHLYNIRNESWYLELEAAALSGYEGVVRRASVR